MKNKKFLSVLLAAVMSLSVGTSAFALDHNYEFTVADALMALKASAGLVTLTDEIFRIYDIDMDNVITTADALAILRIATLNSAEPSLSGTPLAPQNFEPLTPQTERKLLENYAAFQSHTWWDRPITADDLMIYKYFGTFNGYEVVIIYLKDGIMTMDMQYIHLAGYTITVGSGSLSLMVHVDGTFIHITEAFEQGYLSADDIRVIAGV
jgi:hypothetical protein